MSKENVSNKIIALKNVELLVGAMHDVINSPSHLPKFIVFSGYSGYGKSYSAIFAMNKFDCAYVEIGASWGISHLLDNILKELGTTTKEKTIAKKMEVVIEALSINNKPLILDETDHMVKPRALDIIREIHDATNIPIVLIGEELLGKKLESFERVSNRCLRWISAEPVSLEDTRHLASLYVPKVKIADDLLSRLVKLSQGRVRRVAVNLELIKNEAILNGWTEIDLKTWGSKQLYTGNAPTPRRI